MKCLEYNALPWWRAIWLSREHKCKVLTCQELFWYEYGIKQAYSYTQVDYFCVECLTTQKLRSELREKSLKELDLVIVKW